VGKAIGMHGVPMPVPHTRPLQVTGPGAVAPMMRASHGGADSIRVPGSVMGLVEYRLKEVGREAETYSVLVPSYLGSVPFSAGAVELLKRIGPAGQLELDLSRLEAGATEMAEHIEAQVARTPELAAAVAGLEERYDEFQAEPDALTAQAMPTGEELAAELERFLAELPDSGDNESDL
jgi:hypothetical protein